jgi:hypothetical protein
MYVNSQFVKITINSDFVVVEDKIHALDWLVEVERSQVGDVERYKILFTLILDVNGNILLINQ